jgi:hypothetical protein
MLAWTLRRDVCRELGPPPEEAALLGSAEGPELRSHRFRTTWKGQYGTTRIFSDLPNTKDG